MPPPKLSRQMQALLVPDVDRALMLRQPMASPAFKCSPRQPWLWLGLWVVYSQATLGYFGYQRALLGFLCGG